MTRFFFSKLGLTLAAFALLVAACGSDAETADETVVADAAQGQLMVSDAWSRQPTPGQTTAAVYAVVSNATNIERQIVGVTSPLTDRAELHETVIDEDGVATMQARYDGFLVGAGQTLMFEPGGAHVMLRDIDPTTLGSAVDVVFEFDDGETIAVVAEVRNDLAADAMDDDMDDHSTMDDDAMNDDAIDDDAEDG